MDWLKAIANGLGLVEFWSKYFGQKKQEETGAALQQGANDAETLKVLSDVGRAVSVDESHRLWDENKAKFGDNSGE